MIASALLSLLPVRAWLYGGLALTLAALVGWHVLHEAGQRRAAVDAAIAASDARWQAALARANAETETKRKADQARIDDLSARLIDQQTLLDATLATTEAENAKLPDAASCVLDRARVRLLGRL